ncbi:MAG: hypothetical protein AAFU72_02545 [Pseudomonadota bacterium]
MTVISVFPGSQAPHARKWRSVPQAGEHALIARMRRRLALRRMLRNELLREPDSVLADAGWTREEALREARKPIWQA